MPAERIYANLQNLSNNEAPSSAHSSQGAYSNDADIASLSERLRRSLIFEPNQSEARNGIQEDEIPEREHIYEEPISIVVANETVSENVTDEFADLNDTILSYFVLIYLT